MEVTVYDASDAQPGDSLLGCPSVQVSTAMDWTVENVLVAGRHQLYNFFALITPNVEADVHAGQRDSIGVREGVATLFGVDTTGAVRTGTETEPILWDEFARAVDSGLYSGENADAIVVYREGTAGGLTPDGLWDIIQVLWGRGVPEVIIGVAASVTTQFMWRAGGWVLRGPRRRSIAKQFRERGITGIDLIGILSKRAQWDPLQLEALFRVTNLEAKAMLANAGYLPGNDQLWRLSDSAGARSRREALRAVERRVLENPDTESAWSDDFPLTDDE